MNSYLKIPASVPRQFRVPDDLGFKSFSAQIAARDWHVVNDLALVTNCLWQQLAGGLTFHTPGQTLTLGQGQAAFVLPAEYELLFADAEPRALISVVPDEPLRRIVRTYPVAHGMLRVLKPTGDRLHRLCRAPLPGQATGRHVQSSLRALLGNYPDWRFVQALGDRPCRELRDEEPRKIEEPPEVESAGRYPGSKTLAHFELDAPRRRKG